MTRSHPWFKAVGPSPPITPSPVIVRHVVPRTGFTPQPAVRNLALDLGASGGVATLPPPSDLGVTPPSGRSGRGPTGGRGRHLSFNDP